MNQEDGGTTSAFSRELLTTGEVLKQSGFPRETFYRYLSTGLIREAERTQSGRKRFDPGVVDRLRFLRDLNESGYTLRDIRETFKSAFARP
ncbi:MAG: MerR family transcriptional regulator [Planctomycetota bacterium]